jgi:lipoprotein-anchoring transpeptidase ErfK/SrfK
MRIGIMVPVLALLIAACRDDNDANDRRAAADSSSATVYAQGDDRLTAEEIEAGRLEMDWREWVDRDTAGVVQDTTGAADDTAQSIVTESWDSITPESVNRGPIALPLRGDVSGPSVLRVQILLSRSAFSPGIVDGRWGRNTEKAIYWLQRREGIRPTGHIDQRTWQRLQELSGEPVDLVREQQLSEDEVAGPFITLPREYYDRRDLDCQCYESLAEKLAERYHTSIDLLQKLNPGVDLNTLRAGATLVVPAVARVVPADGGNVAKLVVSDGGRYLHALDASGRLLYHFPATLGSQYSPSPEGDYRITNIAHDPTWHYQPDLLEGVDDDEPDAVLPAGPNNAVGVVWMALSRPHYGIHGTSAPETIGYATSNGCVRLTNWDADFLSRRLTPGTPVQFRDVRSGA